MRLSVASSALYITYLAPAGANLPVIAVFGHPSNSSRPACGGECEMVLASYVKWLQSAGGRSLPISYTASPAVMKYVMDNVNGLLLPGGNPPITSSARWAIEYAKKLNEDGDFFPVWGTCLGWEWMAQTLAEDDSVVSRGFDALNVTQPFGVLHGAEDSRMLSGFPHDLLAEASTEPLATNNHFKAVTQQAFTESGLSAHLRLLAIDADRAGRKYVSAVEAFELPMYGVQWHPEKSQFQWGLDPDGTPHFVVNHTVQAIQLSQGLANFFVSETRRNQHDLADVMEWEALMFHTREASVSGPSSDQTYYLHFEDDYLQLEDDQSAVLSL